MNTHLLMAFRLAQKMNSYDSSRIHKAYRSDSRTKGDSDGIFLQDHRQHHRPDGSEKEGDWQ